MKTPENKAEKLLMQYSKLYIERKLPELMSLFTKDINMWGTALDEHRVGIKEVEQQFIRDWLQSEKNEIELISFIPTPYTALWTAAIFRVNAIINNKKYVFDNLRHTIIVEQENNAWKIAHMHVSFPDIRNLEDHSFPIN